MRPCLQWIESPEAQGHATVFVAKFFGRAGLMSFISAVPEAQRPGTCVVGDLDIKSRPLIFLNTNGRVNSHAGLLFET